MMTPMRTMADKHIMAILFLVLRQASNLTWSASWTFPYPLKEEDMVSDQVFSLRGFLT